MRFQPREGPSRGFLRDCETSIFTKVHFQLKYLTISGSPPSYPASILHPRPSHVGNGATMTSRNLFMPGKDYYNTDKEFYSGESGGKDYYNTDRGYADYEEDRLIQGKKKLVIK